MKSFSSKYLYFFTVSFIFICLLLIFIQNNDYLIPFIKNNALKLIDREDTPSTTTVTNSKNTTTTTTTSTTPTKNNNTKLSIETNRINSNKYAVISTTFDDNYLFYIPMVVHAWRRINIEPILVLIYDNDKFRHKRNTSSHQTLSYLKNELNVNILNLAVNANP